VLAPRCGVTTTGLELEQRRVGARLGREHVDAGAADAALLDGQGERVLVDQPAAGSVDDPHAGLYQLQLALADQADRLRVSWAGGS
jgi:hypothetical protein